MGTRPKVNLSYAPFDVVMIDTKTGKLTREGMQIIRTLNGMLDRVGGVTGQSIHMRDYTVATVPDATAHAYGLIFVTDEAGGATMAFADGAGNWRRVQDRAIIS